MTSFMETTSALPGSFVWKESMVDQLIILFRDNPCLYDTNYDDYHDKDQKKASFEKMAEELGITSECMYITGVASSQGLNLPYIGTF